MPDIYSQMRAVAGKLLKDYRQGPMTLDVQTKSGTDYDPTISYTSTPFDGVVRGVNEKELTDATLSASDLVVTMPGALSPTNADKVTIDGRQHSIVKVESRPPAGVAVVHTVYIR